MTAICSKTYNTYMEISWSKKMNKETEEKYQLLKDIIGEWGRCVVAFSGGCDSSLLLNVASDVLGAAKVLAVTARSPSFPAHELEEARRGAAKLGVEHMEFDTDELSDPEFVENSKDRCYYCKRELFNKVREIAKRQNISVVCDASNHDDAENDYRPGLRALKELGIRSPLKEAKLSKREVRSLSRRLGLPTHDRPSFACLASRFPYGEKITEKKLDRVGRAELVMKEAGYRQFRVRSHGDVSRIELGPEEDWSGLSGSGGGIIVKKLKKLGYVYVTLDLEGYRTGSMNEAIGEKSIPIT